MTVVMAFYDYSRIFSNTCEAGPITTALLCYVDKGPWLMTTPGVWVWVVAKLQSL